jgi:hypothetical protein
MKLVEKVEKLINKRIRYLAVKTKDLGDYVKIGENEALLLWDTRK